MNNSVLLAVDDSPASDKAIDYLADWLEGTQVSVHVVHVLPHATTPKQKASGKPTSIVFGMARGDTSTSTSTAIA